MEIKRLNLVFFSPTCTTKRVLRGMARAMAQEMQLPEPAEYDLTGCREDYSLSFGPEDFVLTGAPVYGGRISSTATLRFSRVIGENTPATVIVTYGNRDYEDALLELTDLLVENGFKPAGAAAVVAEHSIVPSVASGRPDAGDKALVLNFTSSLCKMLSQYSSPEDFPPLAVRGNRPYRPYHVTPLLPCSGSGCTKCGLCASSCPVGAISDKNPGETDKDKCISCVRCIRICPVKARKIPRLQAVAVDKLLRAKCRVRREPDFFLPGESRSTSDEKMNR